MTSTDWHNVAVFKPSLRMSVEQNVMKGLQILTRFQIVHPNFCLISTIIWLLLGFLKSEKMLVMKIKCLFYK
jgi:hypothetical protein